MASSIELPESTNLNTYFYDDAMGAWWWTSQDSYP